jgi:hypothetical protein
MLAYTSKNQYEEGYEEIKKYEKIQNPAIVNAVKKFLLEIGAEKALWEQLWSGVETFKQRKQYLTFETIEGDQTKTIRGRVLDAQPPFIELQSTKKIMQNVNSLSSNTLKLIIKRGKGETISQEEMGYRIGLYLFSQKRIEDARAQFKEAGRSKDFEEKVRYYP